MQNKPRGFLCHFNIARQLAARNAFLVRRGKVDCQKPFLQWDAAFFKDRSVANAKFLVAIFLAAFTRFVFQRVVTADGSAMRAHDAIRLTTRAEMFNARLLIGESRD